MPDADTYFAKIPDGPAGPFADALLICLTEIYSANGQQPTLYRYKLGPPDPQRPVRPADWDTFNAPDALVSFRFRGEHPITLYGPEDHWGFYISVPRVRLAAGDLVEVRLWDRDATANEFIGEASTRFEGQLPLLWRAPYFTMKCQIMPTDQVLREAAPLLKAVDQRLQEAASWRLDATRYDLGMTHVLDGLLRNWPAPNMRYLAGFLGWDHPLVQERLRRINELQAEHRQRRQQFVAARLRGPGRGGTVPLGGGSGEAQVTPLACTGPQVACTAEVVVHGARRDLGLCSPGSQLVVAGVDKDGNFVGPQQVLVPQGEGWVECAHPHQPQEVPLQRVRVRLAPGVALLWVGNALMDGQVVRLY